MKKLFILTSILAGSLIATKSYSQVYVSARIGFGHRPVYVAPVPAPAPAVVYQDSYQSAPAPVCEDGYAPAPVTYEDEYPGYVYYNYPAWQGHYRDQFYYDHYRPFFEREHPNYARIRFEHERFQNERFGRERFERQRFDHDRFERGRSEHRGRW